MAWTTPVSKSQGDLISLATWNSDVVANPQYLYDNLGILDAKVGYSLLGSTGSFSFTSIPGTYDDLLIVGQVRGSSAVAIEQLILRFNNDSGSNYTSQRLLGAATSASADQPSSTSYVIDGAMAGNSATAGIATSFRVWIPGYAKTTFHKGPISQSGTGTSLTLMSGRWANTAAITRIDLIAGTSTTFLTGSSVAIFATQSV